jgi:hypothetical protein
MAGLYAASGALNVAIVSGAGGDAASLAEQETQTAHLSQIEAAVESTTPVQTYNAHRTDTIVSNTTELIPKFAIIDAATSGDNTLLAAVASKKIRVISLYLISAGTVNVRFESGAGGTALSGQMNLVANAGFVLPFNPTGWFETASNTLLNLELSGAVSVDGGFTYVEV